MSASPQPAADGASGDTLATASAAPNEGSLTGSKDRGDEDVSLAGSASAAGKSDDGDDADDDDLFGADDDDEAEGKARTDGLDEEGDDDDDAVKQSKRKRRRVDAQTASASSSMSRESAGRGGSLAPSSPGKSPTPASEGDYAALEHRETSAEPPMGSRGRDDAAPDTAELAAFSLPTLPVRRGAPHFYARLPNLLQYRAEVFDEATFNEEQEDRLLQSREGIRIDDKSLRSLLISSNTIRWRWSDKAGSEGASVRVPESNARIVRWNDGTSSLQLGSEFYDISQATERAQGVFAEPSKSSIVPPQPIQHLSHLFVKHDGQEQVNMYQAEGPILGSMMFRPTSITSESHQRLAKAVRKQKGALVKETVVREDPEAEKERKEREQRKAQQKRAREARKRQKAQGDDEDDDAFWANARTTRRSLAGAAARRAGFAGDAYDDDDDLVGDSAAVDGGLDDVSKSRAIEKTSRCAARELTHTHTHTTQHRMALWSTTMKVATKMRKGQTMQIWMSTSQTKWTGWRLGW